MTNDITVEEVLEGLKPHVERVLGTYKEKEANKVKTADIQKKKRENTGTATDLLIKLIGDFHNEIYNNFSSHNQQDLINSIVKTPWMVQSKYVNPTDPNDSMFMFLGRDAEQSVITKKLTLKLVPRILEVVRAFCPEYIPEFSDCDDFTNYFRAVCRVLDIRGVWSTMAISGNHAFICWLVKNEQDELEWLAIEPQAKLDSSDDHIYPKPQIGGGGKYDTENSAFV